MFSNSLDTVVIITFVINLFIATFLMVRKHLTNQNKIPPELKKILYRLFASQTIVTFGMHIQMPYKYQLYLENGLTHSTISRIMCYHQLITGGWNIFLPFAIKYFGHRNLIIFATLCSSFSSFIIGKSDSSINAFIVASCFGGLTMPTIVRCFQDIWQLEEKLMPVNWKANFVYNETRSLVSLITTWIISPLSSFVASRYGTRSVFNFSTIIILISIIPAYFLIKNPSADTENNGNNKKKNDDLSLVVKQFKEHKITYFIILIDILFSIGMFLFHQRSNAFLLTKEHKPPMGFVSGTYGVLDLIGAQVISLFSHFLSYQGWLSFFALIMGTNMVLVFLFYQNKIVVFGCICANSFLSSGFQANNFFLHKQFYPSNLRNYFMSLFRVPTSIISFLIMWFWRTENIEYYAGIAGFLRLILAFLYTLLISKDDNGDEKLLLEYKEKEKNENDSDIKIKMEEEEEEENVDDDVDENNKKQDESNSEEKKLENNEDENVVDDKNNDKKLDANERND